MGSTPSGAALVALAGAVVSSGLMAAPAAAQTVSGRVVDPSTGQPVALAGVHLFDADRNQVSLSIADSLGRYVLDVPESGEYHIFAQRLGYFETVSPLLAISDDRPYDIDLELRPEPIRLDPFEVTVTNEEAYRWWRLRYGINPAAEIGFRMYQGARVEEAKLRGRDNTEFLRFLYIPISHGRQVCIASTPRPQRGGWHRTVEVSPVFEDARPNGTGTLAASGGGEAPDGGSDSCGRLFVDGRRVPNEHIESVNLANIAVVMVRLGEVHLYSREFGLFTCFRPRVRAAARRRR